MKKLLLYISFVAVILSCDLAIGQSSRLDSLWQSGNDNYATGNFESAIESYTKIEASGYESARLYYNMANAYYRTKQIGKSVLYYKKSLKLDPANADAKANLAMAKARSVDKIEKVPEFVLITWIKNLRNKLSSDSWAVLALCFVFAVLALLLLSKFYLSKTGRRVALIGAIVLFLLSLISFGFSYSLYKGAVASDEGVVISSVAGVKSSPSNEGTPIFILHEGAECKILESVQEWSKIEISDGRQGWVKSIDVENV